MGRVLGLDFGAKTVGVAVSDPLEITAQGVGIIRRKSENKLRQTFAQIETLAKEYGVRLIVIGMPKHMNNDMGERAQKTMEFGDTVARRTGLPVVYQDERLTTVAAGRAMNEMNLRGEARKEVVDEIAAVLILQTWLDSPGHTIPE